MEGTATAEEIPEEEAAGTSSETPLNIANADNFGQLTGVTLSNASGGISVTPQEQGGTSTVVEGIPEEASSETLLTGGNIGNADVGWQLSSFSAMLSNAAEGVSASPQEQGGNGVEGTSTVEGGGLPEEASAEALLTGGNVGNADSGGQLTEVTLSDASGGMSVIPQDPGGDTVGSNTAVEGGGILAEESASTSAETLLTGGNIDIADNGGQLTGVTLSASEERGKSATLRKQAGVAVGDASLVKRGGPSEEEAADSSFFLTGVDIENEIKYGNWWEDESNQEITSSDPKVSESH
jgi:hypothetical protein